MPKRHFWEPENWLEDKGEATKLGDAYKIFRDKFFEEYDKTDLKNKSNEEKYWKLVIDNADQCIKSGLREDVSSISNLNNFVVDLLGIFK